MREVALSIAIAGLAAAAGCKKSEPSPAAVSSASATLAPLAPASGSPTVVAESLPRCRVDGARLAIPGEDVVAGDAAVFDGALLVGVVRREGARRLASVVRASLDLASLRVIELGPALGDDPPPSPRVRGATAFVASFARAKPAAGTAAGADGGAGPGSSGGAGAPAATRLLEVHRLEPSGLVSEGSVVQQADESLAYDIAWPDDKGAPLVAWDEDAPPRAGAMLADRGVVKVQLLGAGAKSRVASPESSDAEAPRLLARRGGYWLAWLARRSEAPESPDAGASAEGPGERRAYRWVEVVALDTKGEVTSPVRRISPEKGRVASFELATSNASTTTGGDAQLLVVVQDEAAHVEGAGERIVRYGVDGEKMDVGDLLDGGVGHALAELLTPLAGDAAAPRWLAFTDTQERAHLVPVGPAVRLAGRPTAEPSLDGARIVASAPPDAVYAVGSAGVSDAAGGRIELRRLVCR